MASTTARVIAGSTTRATRPPRRRLATPRARPVFAAWFWPVGSVCAELMLPRARTSLDDGHGPVEGVPKGEGDQHGRPEEGRVLRAVVLGGEDEIAEPAGGPGQLDHDLADHRERRGHLHAGEQERQRHRELELGVELPAVDVVGPQQLSGLRWHALQAL